MTPDIADGTRQLIDGDSNQQAGRDILNVYSGGAILTRLPSLLADIVPLLSRSADPVDDQPLSYEVTAKIEHNSLRAYRDWIEGYSSYGHIVDNAYEELDAAQPGARHKILRQFKARYDVVKAEVIEASSEPDPLSAIRASADKILRRIYDQVEAEIRQSGSKVVNSQDVEPCAIMLVCHAFISCKILERPTDVGG
jgi:hypothetical protein